MRGTYFSQPLLSKCGEYLERKSKRARKKGEKKKIGKKEKENVQIKFSLF